MKTYATKTVVLSKKELLAILAKHFGVDNVEDVEEITEEYGWSGQVWDDGPLPTRMVGLRVTMCSERRMR